MEAVDKFMLNPASVDVTEVFPEISAGYVKRPICGVFGVVVLLL